jgi:hypothetical protein
MNLSKLPEEKSILQLTNRNLVVKSKDFVDNYFKYKSNNLLFSNKRKELDKYEKIYTLNKFRDQSIYKYFT